MKVAILVPTYCGKEILEYFFQSVIKNEIKPDLFLFVVKPCPKKENDSLITIKKYQNLYRNIYYVIYNGPYGLIKQLLIGLSVLKKLKIDIVIFSDDDTYYIEKDYIKKYIKYYSKVNKIAGLAGRVINAKMDQSNNVMIIEDPPSIPPKRLALWRKPALLFNNIPHQTHFTKGGYVAVWGNDSFYITKEIRRVPSLLGGGSNMSIKLSVFDESEIKNLLPNTKVAMRYEQVIGYHLVKKGYYVIKDYDIKAYHLFREGETRSSSYARIANITATDDFLFYYMKMRYPNDFSTAYKIISIFQRIYRSLFIEFRKVKSIKLLVARLIGHLYGNILGIWYLLAENKDYVYIKFSNFEIIMKNLLEK